MYSEQRHVRIVVTAEVVPGQGAPFHVEAIWVGGPGLSHHRGDADLLTLSDLPSLVLSWFPLCSDLDAVQETLPLRAQGGWGSF